MHSWQNGTRCSDVVKVLWSHSHRVRIVFESFIYGLVFIHKTVLRLVPAVFFLLLFRGGMGDQREDAWFVKYKSIELCCSQRTNSCCKLKRFELKLKLTIKLLCRRLPLEIAHVQLY